MAWSLGQGGAQGFHWFATEGDALTSFCGLDDGIFPHALDGQPASEPNAIRWLLGARREAKDFPLERFNALQAQATLRWLGHRDDLLRSSARFAREVRRDFADHWEDPACASAGLGDMAALFDQHLLAYADRFPEARYVSPYRLTGRGGAE